MLRRNNKRGDASDIITFLIIIFFLAVSLLVAVFVNDILANDVIRGTQLNSTTVATDAAAQIDTITTKTVQRTFVMILAFLIIGMMVSSFMIRVHPIFLFLYIFILGITIFTAVPLANTYQMLIENTTLATIANQQTMTNWIMEHIVAILLGVGALSMIVLFGKFKNSTPGGSSDL